MERGSRNHSTTLLPSTKTQYRGQREKAETIQLRPYCPQNNIHKTKRESYKYSATPLLSTEQTQIQVPFTLKQLIPKIIFCIKLIL